MSLVIHSIHCLLGKSTRALLHKPGSSDMFVSLSHPLHLEAQRRILKTFLHEIAFVHGNKAEENTQTAMALVFPRRTKILSRVVLDNGSVVRGR